MRGAKSRSRSARSTALWRIAGFPGLGIVPALWEYVFPATEKAPEQSDLCRRWSRHCDRRGRRVDLGRAAGRRVATFFEFYLVLRNLPALLVKSIEPRFELSNLPDNVRVRSHDCSSFLDGLVVEPQRGKG